MTSGFPPSSAMPTANETLVRRDALSSSSATLRGPASGCQRYRSAFIDMASCSTSPCSAGVRSSSRRKCLTGVPPAGPATPPAESSR